MAGIYIHIPFCKKACHYCDFHFSTNTRNTDDFFSALLREIGLQHHYLGLQPVDTVYFGGGTPSLMSNEWLQRILARLKDKFSIVPGAEFTLEANPDDIHPEKLDAWQAAGVNRLSIGIQSFFEAHLKWMNRAHSATQAAACIALAQQAGFHNLTVDLIYGTPGLTDAQWTQNIQQAAAFGIPHLSCYALTVEPGTALEKMIDQQKKEPVDADAAARHFEILVVQTAMLGFEHYEISNFAKPGFRSRHNSAYWQGAHYLGLGPSAHSFNGQSRQWNVRNNALYIQSLANNTVPFEVETLSPAQQLNEYIMTSLRTSDGLNLAHVAAGWGAAEATRIVNAAAVAIAGDRMIHANNALTLTPGGKLFADGIAAGLFA